MNRLSIIIPCYNERNTIADILQKLSTTVLPVPREVIVVDDGSTDGTATILSKIRSKYPGFKFVFGKTNVGKTGAINLGLQKATGDYVLIQDADLEYDPKDIPKLVNVAKDGVVVYGSRNLTRKYRYLYPHYFLGGVFLSVLTNVLFNTRLTDIATGYKLIPTKLLNEFKLVETGFDFCYEVTAKLAIRKVQIIEVPISYYPRDFLSGKKIRLKDGLKAIRVILKYRFFAK